MSKSTRIVISKMITVAVAYAMVSLDPDSGSSSSSVEPDVVSLVMEVVGVRSRGLLAEGMRGLSVEVSDRS